MNPISLLFRSRKFLLALLALVSTMLFQFFPGFPPDIWEAIQELALIVIAAIAIEDMARAFAVSRGAIVSFGQESVNPFIKLFRSRKFWVAVLAILTKVVLHVFPNLPTTIWDAVEALAMAVIAGIGLEDAAQHVANAISPPSGEGGGGAMDGIPF